MSDITRREFGTGVAVASLPASASKRPNIVFFCADQHDGRAMGCNGHPVVKTPNMDRLASMGVLFRNAYAGSAVCCPSRASMMTGRYPSDVGCYCNATAFDGRYPTWGHRLRAAGYHTWATGKLDLAPDRDLGFEEFETAHGNFKEPDTTSLFRRPVGYRVGMAKDIDGYPSKKAHSDQRVVRNAVDFLNGQAKRIDKPWVMYLGIEQPKAWGSGGVKKYLDLYPPGKMPLPNIPPGHLENMHESFQVLRNFHMISFPIPDDRVRRARSAYYARVTETDAYLGSVLDLLESSGRLDNTIFVYTADHGEMLGEHGLWFKNELLEGAARVPLIVAGPGLPRGKVVETPVSHVDLVASLLEAGGAAMPTELRGQSLLRLANGKPGHPGYAISESNSHGNCTGSYMVRRGEWKYIYFTGYQSLLFNLRDDPDELVNLADKPAHAAIRKELHSILRSRLDPDAVTGQAFREQERRLAELVKRRTAKEFFQEMAPRLGRGQAAVLTERYYNS